MKLKTIKFLILICGLAVSCSDANFKGLGSVEESKKPHSQNNGLNYGPGNGSSFPGGYNTNQTDNSFGGGPFGNQNPDSRIYGGDGSSKLDPCTPVDVGGSLVNFEDVITKHGLTHGAMVTNQYEKSLGVKFSFVGGGAPIIANVGPPETAFFCDNCAMTQDGVKPGVPVGTYFLTDDGLVGGGAAAANKELVVEYTEPSKELSFDLLDLDGTEAWHAKAYNDKGNIVAEKTVRSTSFLYKNGDIETIVLTSPKREIVKLILSPVAGVGNFGVAFDNFRPHGACL